MVRDVAERDRILTLPVEPQDESALAPGCTEVSWVAWRVTGAAPQEEESLSSRTLLSRIMEPLFLPGRTAIITELGMKMKSGRAALASALAVGIHGQELTSEEAEAAADFVTVTLSREPGAYRLRRIDPRAILAVNPASTTTLITQRNISVPIGGGEDLGVVSRFAPVADPWTTIGHLLLRRGVPTRIRATVLATEASVSDVATLDETLRILKSRRHEMHDAFDLWQEWERALPTALHLRASLRSPLFCSEIAIISESPIGEVFARSIASCFTSEQDVFRHASGSAVGTSKIFLGGWEIETPRDHADALKRGVPMYGGMGRRDLRHLVTCAESPLGFPLASMGEPTPERSADGSPETPARMPPAASSPTDEPLR